MKDLNLDPETTLLAQGINLLFFLCILFNLCEIPLLFHRLFLCSFVILGTLRPDLIESASTLASGNANTIKTHHNDSQLVRLLREKVFQYIVCTATPIF